MELSEARGEGGASPPGRKDVFIVVADAVLSLGLCLEEGIVRKERLTFAYSVDCRFVEAYVLGMGA
jgi:hypothetical protein